MNKSPQEICEMFDNISKTYDKLNDIISLGFDKQIKKQSVNLLKIKNNDNILDLCCGTGDIINILTKKTNNVIGVDFSEKMLSIAQNRYPNIKFIKADATNLPFENDMFDFVTITYGLRNIVDKPKAIQEIYRVLKPNGKILHLDFGEKNFAGKIFEYYVPFIAKFFSQNPNAYRYLINSKQDFYSPKELEELFATNNFKKIKLKTFLFKSIACTVFEKALG